MIFDGSSAVYIGYANGLFYANGTSIGPIYKKSRTKNGTEINGRSLEEYGFTNQASKKEGVKTPITITTKLTLNLYYRTAEEA